MDSCCAGWDWAIIRRVGNWDDINTALVTGFISFCWFDWITKLDDIGCWPWPLMNEVKPAEFWWVLERIQSNGLVA